MPGTPSALGLLFFITHFLASLQVNKHQVRIITHGNPALIDDIPDSRRRVAHPGYDLFQAAIPLVDLVQQQGQDILYRWQPGR